jgi:predicted lipoprotein with Yx(FWY)xxD motif
VLATASGQILYLLTGDSPTQSNCVFPCTFIWTPLTTTGAGVARNGTNQSLLGTIRLPGGTLQVTYAGHPLYTHNGDQANQTTGEGVNLFDGTGYVVAASNGAAIT